MSRSFDQEGYVDVAERIRSFKDRYPDGSLQSLESPRIWQVGDKHFIGYCAAAYRTPDDERPGVGWAWEPVPGPTPFTKDSELMNAETSAWGRAIVALGFETKKIASANEVRNRQGEDRAEGPIANYGEAVHKNPPATEKPASQGTVDALKVAVAALKEAHPSPDPTHDYWNDVKAYMQAEFDKAETGALSEAEMVRTVLEFETRLVHASAAEGVPFG